MHQTMSWISNHRIWLAGEKVCIPELPQSREAEAYLIFSRVNPQANPPRTLCLFYLTISKNPNEGRRTFATHNEVTQQAASSGRIP